LSGSKILPTFWEKTAIPIHQMPSQVPAIAKIIISLDQFDTVTFQQAQLVGTSGRKVV